MARQKYIKSITHTNTYLKKKAMVKSRATSYLVVQKLILQGYLKEILVTLLRPLTPILGSIPCNVEIAESFDMAISGLAAQS